MTSHDLKDSETRLIQLPVGRACIEKWNAGRAKFGPVFQGDPLANLYAEMIDGVNYCDQVEVSEAYHGDALKQIKAIRARVVEIAEEVRSIYVRDNKEA